MPDIIEQMYCSQQIIIPPNLPIVLKKYAKAAIRTQPSDLLVWSASYFKALFFDMPLPVKEKLEYFSVQTISGLTPGFLKVLINQLGNDLSKVTRNDIIEYWSGICLSTKALDEIFAIGGFGSEINWLKFVAICAGYLETSLTRTMILLCHLLTEEPAGGSAHLPLNKFLYLYKYLARIECGPEQPVKPPRPRRSLSESQLSDIDELLSGEGVSYKYEDEPSKSESELSWQGVLKRMGRRESDKYESSLDIDNIDDAEQLLSRGLAWKRINEIELSEPDTSRMKSPSCHSDVGIQVFEPTDDELLDVKRIPEEEAVRDLSRSEALIDITEVEGDQKSLDEIEGMQEFQTTLNTREAARAAEELEEYTESESTDDEQIHGIEEADDEERPRPRRLEMVRPIVGNDLNQLEVLVEVDSSTILVPTPVNQSEVNYQSSCESIKRVESEEDKSEDNVSTDELQKLKCTSLHDVRVPNLQIATLKEKEESIHEVVPVTIIHEQQWANVPGIGKKVPEQQIKEVEDYLKECASKQGGAVMPRNIRHFLCPPLEVE